MGRGDFKPHIEGLRAFAVLPILLFHLDPSWCPGGFVGVDIFFVISGYLITGMILAQENDFSFTRFYVRRFFRLFPALVVTLIATVIAGWFVLSPVDYVRLAYSAMTAVAAVSNIYFLFAVDYFHASALLHPLLHTWSLAVEEQFYLLWPALVVLWLSRGWPLWGLLLGTTVLSFAAIPALQNTAPDAVFYLTPFRMFEFSLGACLLLLQSRCEGLNDVSKNAASLAGFALLGASLFVVGPNTPWPGPWTLLPCISTGLLILFGGSAASCGLLQNGLVRYLGRISYSLYLVHWPLIALYFTYTITEPSMLDLVALGLASVALGALLFEAVETPFRQPTRVATAGPRAPFPWRHWRRPFPMRAKAPFIGLLAVLVFAGTAAIAARGGFPERLDQGRVQNFDNGLTYAGDLCSYKRDRCVFGDPQSDKVVFLIGDSMALNWVYGLDALFRETGIRGISLYDHGCLFAYGTRPYMKGVVDQRCLNNLETAYKVLAQNRSPVILAHSWASYQGSIGKQDDDAPLKFESAAYYEFLKERLIEGLDYIGANERTVVLIKQPYTTGIDIARCLSQPGMGNRDRAANCASMPRVEAFKNAEGADQMIDDVKSLFPSLVVIDPKSPFCRTETCTVYDDQGLYFRDSSHLTNSGSLFMVTGVREALTESLLPGAGNAGDLSAQDRP